MLLLASASAARSIHAALAPKIALTVTDDLLRARALAATGGFIAVLAAKPLDATMREAIAVNPTADPKAIADTVAAAIAGSQQTEREDAIAALPYEEYIELARYASTRRYLIALLARHGGSVTEAARGASMKRESLHRLMRRHFLIADDFRE